MTEAKGTKRKGGIAAMAFAATVWAASSVFPAQAAERAGHRGWVPIPVVLAQGAQPSAETPPSGVVTQSSRSFVLDGLIVAALFGGALFAVCRSSNRT